MRPQPSPIRRAAAVMVVLAVCAFGCRSGWTLAWSSRRLVAIVAADVVSGGACPRGLEQPIVGRGGFVHRRLIGKQVKTGHTSGGWRFGSERYLGRSAGGFPARPGCASPIVVAMRARRQLGGPRSRAQRGGSDGELCTLDHGERWRSRNSAPAEFTTEGRRAAGTPTMFREEAASRL